MRKLVILACFFLAACSTGPLTAKQQVAIADSVYQEAVRQAINARDDGRLVKGTPAYERVDEAIVTGDLLLTQAWALVQQGTPSNDPALVNLLREISSVTRELRLEIEGKNVSDRQRTPGNRSGLILDSFGPPDPADCRYCPV